MGSSRRNMHRRMPAVFPDPSRFAAALAAMSHRQNIPAQKRRGSFGKQWMPDAAAEIAAACVVKRLLTGIRLYREKLLCVLSLSPDRSVGKRMRTGTMMNVSTAQMPAKR
jgi:hypothetical protein